MGVFSRFARASQKSISLCSLFVRPNFAEADFPLFVRCSFVNFSRFALGSFVIFSAFARRSSRQLRTYHRAPESACSILPASIELPALTQGRLGFCVWLLPFLYLCRAVFAPFVQFFAPFLRLSCGSLSPMACHCRPLPSVSRARARGDFPKH